MGLKLYLDPMSQPSRATLLFLRVNCIPFVPISVSLRKGEHKQQEFLAVNPRGKVPAIDHNGFILTESVAILKYLCRSFPVSEHWYPKSIQEAARVDEFMSWQHLNLRIVVSKYFRVKVIEKGKSTHEEFVVLEELEQMLDQLEKCWLVPKCFIKGSRNMTIADLLAVSELEQLAMAGYNFTGNHDYPILNDYIRRVKSNLEPHFQVINMAAYKICQEMMMNSESKSRRARL